jgi:DNA-binding NtrC family response regulator
VESAAILASGETIGVEGFSELGRRPGPAPAARVPSSAAAGASVTLPVGTTLEAAERELILATLRRHPSKREAAQVLGIGLRTLYTKLAAYQPQGATRATAESA